MEMNFSMIKARIADAESGNERRRSSRLDVEIEARVRELGDAGPMPESSTFRNAGSWPNRMAVSKSARASG